MAVCQEHVKIVGFYQYTLALFHAGLGQVNRGNHEQREPKPQNEGVK
jgi:hypothetical protein